MQSNAINHTTGYSRVSNHMIHDVIKGYTLHWPLLVRQMKQLVKLRLQVVPVELCSSLVQHVHFA